ncbi:peptidoglycan DD-metalloendopeptidase family protein [Anaerolinea sp.]|uniref:peptidoglycan DD-metalloendopeptidase family protein n=1 Tax=Anaerolinea sp. TaxID=1872519 RepID=UPI002ACDDCC7|nr:peptidoglycan DD-metalloendopeptidase family protein [Anaerolinea sp.]
MTEDSHLPSPLSSEIEEVGEPRLAEEEQRPASRWSTIWEHILRLGLGEIALRAGTLVVSIALILLVIWVMARFYLKGNVESAQQSVLAAPLPSPTPTVQIPAFKPVTVSVSSGIPRLARLDTYVPSRPRFEITTYEVQKGDTVFGIAEKFGLKPQSILWGNFETLADDPHRLQIGMKLNILPVDGVLYRWHEGDSLLKVAEFYGVTPETIIDWPGNHLDAAKLGDLSKPNIEPGTLVFVPGGKRDFISWSAPFISRRDPAKAKIFGPGYCGTQVDGYIGNGSFVWPTTERWLSGYDYSPETNHWGIDIAGRIGNPIYAADSGVVVYSGWNENGYGYVVVIDHGNGWQTLYAHLSQIYAGCGASVSQGDTVGAMGSTGRSTGPHLHFEIMSESGVRVNPWSFLQ